MHLDPAPAGAPADPSQTAGQTAQDLDESVSFRPAAPDPPCPAEPALPEQLARIEAALGDLAGRWDVETERASARERVIDRQHEEIERLRTADRAGQLRPVVTDLCRLRNDLLLQARTHPPDMTGRQVTDLLISFADMVEQALERCGVAVLPPEAGARFVAGRHQAARSVPVEDAALDGTVAEVIQDGYAEIDGGRVVSPSRVAVHRMTTPAGTTTTDHSAKETIDD